MITALVLVGTVTALLYFPVLAVVSEFIAGLEWIYQKVRHHD